jgi:hypothetical protein
MYALAWNAPHGSAVLSIGNGGLRFPIAEAPGNLVKLDPSWPEPTR